MAKITLHLELTAPTPDKAASIITQGKVVEALKPIKDVRLVDITDDLSEAPRRKRRKNAAAVAGQPTAGTGDSTQE